ncbi:hypothetical protein [Streptomyces sp. NPDC127084]|uniref:hypothetical protein n=1 Tax=Streptomyces sp. NPDC127084 TaxID=3347133 RepID=UPI00366024AB
MILVAFLMPPAMLLLVLAMDRYEERLGRPPAPRHTRPRLRLVTTDRAATHEEGAGTGDSTRASAA